MLALFWWVDRWRKSTAYTDMTLDEQGAYRNLLDEATLRDGALPTDERVLAKACGDATRWKRVRAAVLQRFEVVDGVYRNATLDEVLHQSRRRADNQARYRARLKPQHAQSSLTVRRITDNASDNGPTNGATNKPHSPDPDPDQKQERTPQTPRAGGLITREERAKASEELRAFRASQPRYVAGAQREPGKDYHDPLHCPHDPQHDDDDDCIALLVAARRRRIRHALAMNPPLVTR